MDTLAQYGSDSDGEGQEKSTPVTVPKVGKVSSSLVSINATPLVDLEREKRKQVNEVDHTKGLVFHNPRVENMWKPVQGPTNPHYVGNRVAPGYQNHETGQVYSHSMHEVNFNEQMYSYNVNASASAPEGGKAVGGGGVGGVNLHGSSGNKRKRLEMMVKDAEEIQEKHKTALTIVPEATEEEKEKVEKLEKEEDDREKKRQVVQEMEEKTNFHGKSDSDYLGRSWVLPPRDWKPDPEEECFLPKKAPSHLCWSCAGRVICQILSEVWPPSSLCWYGWKGKNMGHCQSRWLYAYLFGAWQSSARC